MKKAILLISFLAIMLALPSATLLAQGSNAAGGKGAKKSTPFLITAKLPHLTKLLIRQWDNPGLQLSSAQKEKLLVVRKNTIAGVKALTQKIVPLESLVVEGIFAKETPEELNSVVGDIARLKAEATMVHLRCIYDTREILDAEQLNFLLDM